MNRRTLLTGALALPLLPVLASALPSNRLGHTHNLIVKHIQPKCDYPHYGRSVGDNIGGFSARWSYTNPTGKTTFHGIASKYTGELTPTEYHNKLGDIISTYTEIAEAQIRMNYQHNTGQLT